MTAPASHRGPVFVGGTGRSGTTIAGELIGHSDAYALIPIEVRFHTDAAGLIELAHGRVSFAQFEDAMLNRWYFREPNSTGPRGVHVIMERHALDAALHRLRTTHELEPWNAAGRFLREVLDPVAARAGKVAWVEMTPPNARRMNDLARMVPDAKFVHMVRDGRDVASSVVPRSWGPNDFPKALKWWSDQLIAIERARSETEPDRVLTMRLESLVGSDREGAYGRLASFLPLADDSSMRRFFDSKVSVAKARADRWLRGLDEQEAAEVQTLYQSHLRRLARAGATLPEAT